MEEAIATANSALDRDQFNISVLYELYLCYSDLKQATEVKETLAKLLRLSRGNAHTLIDYAIEYAALGLYAEAIGLMHRAGENNPDPMINYYSGYYWYKAGDEHKSLVYT